MLQFNYQNNPVTIRIPILETEKWIHGMGNLPDQWQNGRLRTHPPPLAPAVPSLAGAPGPPLCKCVHVRPAWWS